MIKVALYVRVSTEEQAQEGVSIDAQLAALQMHAKLKSWQIAGQYIDPGYSGSTDQRPGFQRLLLDAKRHSFDIVAVAKLDRFFRNLRLLLNYLHELEELRVNFIATQEGLDTSTPHGKFSVQILGVIAEFERVRIGERIKEGKRYRVSQGKWASGCTLYGYRWLPKEQQWQIVENEAKVVCYIYHLYVDENLGSMRIPVRLNSEGYRTRKGASWGYSAVTRILTHPAYKGRHHLGLKMPVIVDEATWELAQKKRRRSRSVRRTVRNWLLQGLCVCGLCGRTLSCVQKKPHKPRYYACRGRVKDSHLDGSPYCQSPRIEAEWLEKAVWSKFRETLSDSTLLRQGISSALAKLEERKKQLEVESEPIDLQLESLKGKMERWGIAYGDGTIPKERYEAELSKLKRQQSDLMRRKANVDPQAELQVSRLQDYIDTAKEILDKGIITVEETGVWGYWYNAEQGRLRFVPFGSGLNANGIVRRIDKLPVIASPVVKDDGSIEFTYRRPLEDLWMSQPHVEPSVVGMRALLEKFDIKVWVFPERVEIRGFLPAQFIEIPAKATELRTKRNICSGYLPGQSHPHCNQVTGL